MRNLVGFGLAFTMLLLVGGCSKSICEEAFDKQKACAQNIDCNAQPAGLARTACEASKTIFANLDFDQSKSQCEAKTPGNCECDGTVEAASQKAVDCTLDPKTCSCK